MTGVMNRTQQASIVLLLNLCLVAYAAATTVLVYVSPQEAFIAADSLSNRLEGGQRMVCKIAQVSDHMLFAAAGTGTTLLFNPYDLAKTNASNSRNPHEAAEKYAGDAWWPLQTFWRANRARYLELSPAGMPKPKGPQSFVFVGLNEIGLLSSSGADFVEFSVTPPILRASELVELTGKDSRFLYRAGIVENLPSDGEIAGWIDANGTPAALKRAIETQSKATPDLVGGEISIVRLSRDGSIQWLNRGECK
jgi:hypothetical protein